jgi:hypothetical protein
MGWVALVERNGEREGEGERERDMYVHSAHNLT